MSTGKIILIVVLIGALIAAILYAFYWGKTAWDKITFSKPRLQAIDLQGLSLKDIESIGLQGTQKEVKVGLAMDIQNDNGFAIPFSSLKAKLYYDGTLIAETSEALAGRDYTLLPKSTLSVSDTISILLNGAAARKMIIQKATGGHPKIEYTIKISIFGIPLRTIKSDISW